MSFFLIFKGKTYLFKDVIMQKFVELIEVFYNFFHMEANNTSCFNYRTITGSQVISLHASGRAIDINPMQNPYIRGNTILPVNSNYDPDIEGTLTGENVIVRSLLSRGWEWGGNRTALKNYQHLEKE